MLVIDRFEGKWAIVEDDSGKIQNIARSLLPRQAKEGDVLRPSGKKYAVDEEETMRRRERIRRLMDGLFP